jgi:hypothetical protein
VNDLVNLWGSLAEHDPAEVARQITLKLSHMVGALRSGGQNVAEEGRWKAAAVVLTLVYL